MTQSNSPSGAKAPPSKLSLLQFRHKTFAEGIAEGEELRILCERLSFPLGVGERLLRSSAFLALVEELREKKKQKENLL